MSRIEITIEEYNRLKTKIEQLNATVADVSKEAANYKHKLSTLETLVMDLEDEGIISRLFIWKTLIKPLKEVFKKND